MELRADRLHAWTVQGPQEFGSGPPSGPPRLTALRPSVGTGCTISLLLGRGGQTGPKCGGTACGWTCPLFRVCMLALADATQEPAFVHVSDPLWLQWLTLMQVWCTPGPSLWCSSCLPFLLKPFRRASVSRCGKLVAQMLPGRMWGSQMWRWTSSSEGSSESQHRLEMNGFLIELWVCNIGLSHIQVKMPVPSDVKLARYHPWFSLSIFEEEKSPLGGREEEGLIDPRSERIGCGFLWLLQKKTCNILQSRYHVMFQLGHTHVGHPNKRIEGTFSDLNSAEWVFHDSRDSAARVNATKSTVLAVVSKSRELVQVIAWATLQSLLWNHPRTET